MKILLIEITCQQAGFVDVTSVVQASYNKRMFLPNLTKKLVLEYAHSNELQISVILWGA